MNREEFFKWVKELREAVGSLEYPGYAHKCLDKIVQNVTGAEKGVIMPGELSLEDDVARIIKRIKQAKEDEALKKQAVELTAKIKAEL